MDDQNEIENILNEELQEQEKIKEIREQAL